LQRLRPSQSFRPKQHTKLGVHRKLFNFGFVLTI
jgi:hypothetical protein